MDNKAKAYENEKLRLELRRGDVLDLISYLHILEGKMTLEPRTNGVAGVRKKIKALGKLIEEQKKTQEP